VTWAKTKFRIALATSATPRNRQVTLALLGLSDSFDFVVDTSGFTHPKPNPEIFHTALRGLNANSADCLVIEDSLAGVTAGKAAGCRVAALTTSFAEQPLRDSGADYIVNNFDQLRELLSR
jgi:HAD superfamily hydrolase (TIGR01509 family)